MKKIKNNILKEEVSLNGWVNRIRNIGKIMFFNLQYTGKETQVIIKEKLLIEEISRNVGTGDLITVKGKYQKKVVSSSEKRIEEIPNELLMTSWKLVNKTINLPFEIKNNLEIKEDNKYRYRYLDLRRMESREVIISKHKLISCIRNFLQRENFIEIETPILSQSSPEGAKTFTVPAKTAGHFYTLPQSPQIFKQILMISGFDKYYQIAKSFRNEDARSNRQPEFLQLDLEMSFISEEEIFTLTEKLIVKILEEVFLIKKQLISFERMKLSECIEKYGTDKPDLRNPLQIILVKEKSSFPINYQEKNNHRELGMYFPLETYSGDLIKLVKEKVSEFRRYSLFKFEGRKWELISGISTVEINKNQQQSSNDGLYLITSDEEAIARKKLLQIRKLYDNFFLNKKTSVRGEFKFLWLTEWPLFRYDKNEKKIISLRHPFTLPKNEEEILKFFRNNKEIDYLPSIKGSAYDLVCNGEELASGSLRIFKKELQERIFEILGFNKHETEEHFGYFLKALDFAAPPHGGIALGIERMLATFLNLKSLKETIAFPKNIDGSCSLTGAPNKLKI